MEKIYKIALSFANFMKNLLKFVQHLDGNPTIGEVRCLQSLKDTKRPHSPHPQPVHPPVVRQVIQKYLLWCHQTTEQLFFSLCGIKGLELQFLCNPVW